MLYFQTITLPFVIALLYLPGMFGLRRLLPTLRPALTFPLLGAFLALPSVMLQWLLFGAGTDVANALRAPESVPFYFMYAAAGALFGGGFLLIQRRH